jgi:hypothetical protein
MRRAIFAASTSVRTLSSGSSILPFRHFTFVNEEDFSRHILKHSWLCAKEARDRDVVQKASIAFED